jgi:[ribosomal protein S5]-alanine N-acetyltransferase
MGQSSLIQTQRLQIVLFGEEHLTQQYVGWLNDPLVVRYSEQRHRTHTLESCRAYWQSFSGTPHYFWAVMTREGELGHIGNLNAYRDPVNQTADVGIMLGERRAWGQGYASEAWSAVCQYLLKEVGLRKITAGTMATNHAMIRVMQRAGMVEDGCRRRQYLWDGQEVDLVQMALFHELTG